MSFVEEETIDLPANPFAEIEAEILRDLAAYAQQRADLDAFAAAIKDKRARLAESAQRALAAIDAAFPPSAASPPAPVAPIAPSAPPPAPAPGG